MTNRLTGGVLVERYRIMERLGESPDGALYRILDTRTEELLILKEIRASHPGSQSVLQPSTRLDHPNLPRVQDQFEADGCHCLILTNIGTISLQQTVMEQGPCSEEQVRWVATAVCSALTYLHKQTPPIIFRHLRPSNLFLDSQGQVILIDAGSPDSSSNGTPRGDRTMIRTPSRRRTVDALPTDGYAPPEPHRGSDPAGDIYALGATLYFLLTSINPPASAEIVLGPAVRGAARLAMDTAPPEMGGRQVARQTIEEEFP